MIASIDALIVLLDSHPEWRFFNRFGEEYVYDSKKAMFRYDGCGHCKYRKRTQQQKGKRQ